MTSTEPPATAAMKSSRARFDIPQQGYGSIHTRLRPGSPSSVGLDPAPLRELLKQLAAWTKPLPSTGYPMYPGAVLLLANNGTVVERTAIGTALKYADVNGTELPAGQQIPMRTDTIFDLASLSKLFTTLIALQLMERGKLDLYAPVAKYVPDFASNGKSKVTIEQLLTHTSGFPPDPTPSLWHGYSTIPARIKSVIESPLVNPPGNTYLYSDLNMLNLQQVVERVTGKALDRLVHDGITRPLGMRDTMYNPPAHLKPRVAPTEFEVGEGSAQRRLVWGQVHDENAWSLGGVAGHAGVFSTADDLSRMGQALLNGGSYGGARVLREQSVNAIFTDYNQRLPGDAHGLGFELDQMWYMGCLASMRTAGHTGFTGTSVVFDAKSRSIAVLLTNRVHPSRTWSSNNLSREACGTALARAQSVHAPTEVPSWYAPLPNKVAAVLTTSRAS